MLLFLTAAASAAVLRVVDVTGRTVVLPHVPTRIISLVPSATEMLYALGVGDRVAGVTANDDYPADVRNKPHVGDIHPDFERIMALRPDLVVVEAGLQAPTLQRLEALHLPVLALHSEDLASFHVSLVTLGHATDRDAAAQRIWTHVQQQVQQVQKAAHSLTHPRVFVEIGARPLFTAGPDTFVGQLVTLAGGINALTLKGYLPITPEAVVAADPDVIILTESQVADFVSRPGFNALRAVKNGHVYAFDPPDMLVRPSPRVGDGLEKLFHLLHS